jgi:hypothetical protein
MSRIFNRIDLHILQVGVLLALISVLGSRAILTDSNISGVLVLWIVFILFEVFLNPMLLTRAFARTQKHRYSYIIANEILIATIAFVTFVGVQTIR